MKSTREILGVLVLVCVAIPMSHGEDSSECGPCNCVMDDTNTLTINCSRRDLQAINANWSQDWEKFQIDGNVLLTFYNNSISNLTELPEVTGSKIAMNFQHNKLVEIEDDTFHNIQKLSYLDLSNNQLTGQVLRSEIFQGPYSEGVYESINLETLFLGHNQIHSLDRRLFQYTPNLTQLYINNNPFEILDHVTVLALASATKLEILDISYTDIDTIPLDAFRGMSMLQQIDLSGNKLTIIPESLALVGATLQYLTFNNNPIVELNDDSFLGLHNLKVLEVSNNDDLEEVKRSTFSPLSNLKTLHLCHNMNLRYISHNAFRTLKDKWTLQEVYFDDNNLSELPTDLMPWNKLQVLGMTGNDWLCNCDLANIVTKQGAGEKFTPSDIPTCIAPMRLSGAYITNISMEYCPYMDGTSSPKSAKFSLSSIKPKHVLWSIFGVAMVVLVGMILGLLVNVTKALLKQRSSNESIRYVNINTVGTA